MMNQALAASLGGWSLGSPVASGASAIVNGTKEIILNGASKIARGTAKITPNASQVAKVLARGGAGYALSVAVEQLLGAVDWVLDPANNQIRYTKPDTSNEPCTATSCAPSQYVWKRDTDLGTFSSQQAICQAVASKYGQILTGTGTRNGSFACFTRKSNGDADWWAVDRVVNPTYDPTAENENEEKTIPLETVAQKVISNAAGGDVSAQQAITAAAQDVINEAENDSAKAAPIVQQLEASKAIEAENTATGEQTQNPDKPNVTNIKLEFPAFCGWAPTVCEAAQTVISFPRTLTNWWDTANQKADSWANSISQAWSEAKDWMTKDETTQEETKVEVDQTVPQIPNTNYFNWSAYCPFSPGSQTVSLENTTAAIDYDLTSWCELAADLRPFVLAAGSLMSFLIASGVIMGRDD